MPILKVHKKSLGFLMCAINVAHPETQGFFFRFVEFCVETLFFIFLMCVINVAHLETQGFLWTFKIDVESLFLIYFDECHQRRAFGNPRNFCCL